MLISEFKESSQRDNEGGADFDREKTLNEIGNTYSRDFDREDKKSF